MELIFGIIIGTFIGWNLPQPSWAKSVQVKILEIIKTK
jgi:hypothetical protein